MKSNNEKKEGNDFEHMKNSKEISRPVYTRRYSKFNDNNIQKILNNNDNKNQYYNNHFSLINNHPKLHRRISLNNYYNNKIFKKEFKQGNFNLNKNKFQRNYNRKSTYTKHLSELDKFIKITIK